MTYIGHVQNGVVVFDAPTSLPDGLKVVVSVAAADPQPALATRDHAAFLASYAPEDEGLYDDYPAG